MGASLLALAKSIYYAWYVAAKALVLSLKSIWYHGNQVNARVCDATIIITFDSQAQVIQVDKYCTINY